MTSSLMKSNSWNVWKKQFWRDSTRLSETQQSYEYGSFYYSPLFLRQFNHNLTFPPFKPMGTHSEARISCFNQPFRLIFLFQQKKIVVNPNEKETKIERDLFSFHFRGVKRFSLLDEEKRKSFFERLTLLG